MVRLHRLICSKRLQTSGDKMKTMLYAVRSTGAEEREWRWHITLHLDTDCRMWLGRSEAGIGHEMVVLDAELAFGQAYVLQQRLNELSSGWMLDTADQAIRRAAHSGCLDRERHRSWRILHSGKTEGHTRTPELQIDLPTWERMLDLLNGRMLLPGELESLLREHQMSEAAAIWMQYMQYGYLQRRIAWTNGMMMKTQRKFPYFWTSKEMCCARCGSDRLHWTNCAHCQEQCPYCEDCLTMGKVRYCTPLFRVVSGEGEQEASLPAPMHHAPAIMMDKPQEAAASRVIHMDRWGLSPAQHAASLAGIQFLDEVNSEFFLIWAVAGAGKTEMIFPLIEHELQRGGRVCVATPRKDVVLELRPRVQRAFPNHEVVTLYGGSEQRWAQGEVTIATTHQLLRFRHAFELVIIDEIDAFPFVNDRQLEYAASQARKPDGRYIFLSATPPAHLQAAAARARLPHVKVPVRYHRYPLPVPQWVMIKPLSEWLRADSRVRAIPRPLFARLDESLQRGAQLFLFVPAIAWVEPLVHMLAAHYPDIVIAGTSSRDRDRTIKVQQFRDGHIRLLVTTTILERGVTVPRTDVFILGADSSLFDEAALVQMAGRAGRSSEDPHGRVYFASPTRTSDQSRAIRHIRTMNRIAARQGYLSRS